MPRSDVSVRAAVVTDLPAVAAICMAVQSLHAEAHPDRFAEPQAGPIEDFFRGQLDRDGAFLLVAEHDGDPVGYAFAALHDRPSGPFLTARRTLSFEHLAVREAAQGKGVGGALIDAVRSLAKRLHAQDIELTVWAINEHAAAVYEHKGYRVLRHAMVVDLD